MKKTLFVPKVEKSRYCAVQLTDIVLGQLWLFELRLGRQRCEVSRWT